MPEENRDRSGHVVLCMFSGLKNRHSRALGPSWAFPWRMPDSIGQGRVKSLNSHLVTYTICQHPDVLLAHLSDYNLGVRKWLDIVI